MDITPALRNLEFHILHEPHFDFSEVSLELEGLRQDNRPFRNEIARIQMLATVVENTCRLEKAALSLNSGRVHLIQSNALLQDIAQYKTSFPSIIWVSLEQRIKNITQLFNCCAELTALCSAQLNESIESYIANWIDRIIPLEDALAALEMHSPIACRIREELYKPVAECFYDDLTMFIENSIITYKNSHNPLLVGVTKYFLENLYTTHQETAIGNEILLIVTHLGYTFTQSEDGAFVFEQLPPTPNTETASSTSIMDA
jgi:hypothetical protein